MPTILHTEASSGLGGQELRIVAESRWLQEHGWSALIACQPGSRLFSEACASAADAVAVRMRSALDLGALWALRRVMRARAVDLVHTHSSTDSWLGALAAKSLGLPVVRSRHVSIVIRSARVYRLADRVVTSGETVRAIVVRAGVPAERVVAIPPGVDTARFHTAVSGKTVRDELRLGDGEALVGLVANIRGSKGHNVFLEAAREILRAAPHARFVIVGDGVGYDEVRRRVSDLGLARHVTMTGFRRDIPEVMAALDVLVLPSIRSEATSQVIPQALAMGTPVVATTVGGSPELIRDGETGRLVPPDDACALARAVLEILRDPERARAMGRAGQARVVARLTLDASMARTTAVYRELLAPGSRSTR
jgi:glycosyltransferase involved in cell wall biosynthesis